MIDDLFDSGGLICLSTSCRLPGWLTLSALQWAHGPFAMDRTAIDEPSVVQLISRQLESLISRLEQTGILDAQAHQGERSALVTARSERSIMPQTADDGRDLITSRSIRPPLPDPRLVRRVIRNRQLRASFLEADLLGEPAWDMLLDLTAARAEHTRVSVTSLCIASGVPPTTALRWIGLMADAGLVQRVEDDTDRRRAFVTLTDKAADAIARYFATLGTNEARYI